MDSLYIFLLILAAIFLFALFYNSKDEEFKYSKGRYVISWSPPDNVSSGEVTSYHIVITDVATKANVVDTTTSDTKYYFTEGDWNTQYSLSITASNDMGTGETSPPVIFTSPQGFYEPSNIQNIQILGRDYDYDPNDTAYLGDYYSGYTPLHVGESVNSMCISFNPPPSEPKLWPQVSQSALNILHPFDVKTSVIVYNAIVYVPSSATSLEECCIMSLSENSPYGTYIIPGNESWQTYPLDVYVNINNSGCSGIINPAFNISHGSACGCPITIGQNDSVVAAMVFVQPYSGAITGVTKLQSIREDIPEAPTNVKYTWTPGFKPPTDIKQFILDNTDVIKAIADRKILHNYKGCWVDDQARTMYFTGASSLDVCRQIAIDNGHNYYSYQTGKSGGCYTGDRGTLGTPQNPGEQGYMMYGRNTSPLDIRPAPDGRNSTERICYINSSDGNIYGSYLTNAVYSVDGT